MLNRKIYMPDFKPINPKELGRMQQDKRRELIAGIKKYVRRYSLSKSLFKIRDEVVFDEYKKSGMIKGFVGDSIEILQKDGRAVSRDKNGVFLVKELIKGTHWDTMTYEDRLDVLKTSNVSSDYAKSSWYFVPFEVKNVIMRKAQGPAGYEGSGLSTVTRGVYNPVHQYKTVSDKMDDEKAKQEKSETK